VQYLVADALGSVRGIVSSSGSLTASTSYDAWGNPEATGGLTSYTPFGFAGGYTDPSGLLYLIGRYYDPATGQFLSVDPLVDETGQPYAYTGDDPVNRVDPSGDIATNQFDQGCGAVIQDCEESPAQGCSAGPTHVTPNPVVDEFATPPRTGSVTVKSPTITIGAPSAPVTITIQATATVSGVDPIGVGIEQDGTVDLSDGGLLTTSISPDGAISAASHDFSVSPGSAIGFSPPTSYQVGPDTVTVAITATYTLNRFPGAGSLGPIVAGAGASIYGLSEIGCDIVFPEAAPACEFLIP
jgi:RHS repeat-associated protein